MKLVDFLIRHRGQKIASPALLGQMTQLNARLFRPGFAAINNLTYEGS